MTLLSPPPPEIALFIDLFIFFSYIVMACFLLYVGKNISYKKKLTLSWVIVAIGLIFTSLNLLIEILGLVSKIYLIPRPILWYVFNTIGSVALIVGFASIMIERQVEMGSLRKRQMEIKDVMKYLKQQYYRRELSEADLRKVYSSLLEQLAEIEIKLKKMKKKK